jgi:hypothetical protein
MRQKIRSHLAKTGKAIDTSFLVNNSQKNTICYYNGHLRGLLVRDSVFCGTAVGFCLFGLHSNGKFLHRPITVWYLVLLNELLQIPRHSLFA